MSKIRVIQFGSILVKLEEKEKRDKRVKGGICFSAASGDDLRRMAASPPCREAVFGLEGDGIGGCSKLSMCSGEAVSSGSWQNTSPLSRSLFPSSQLTP